MPRRCRSHLPGAVFHLTARTQGHEPWFTDALRSRIVEYIAYDMGISDARLLAYAVMSNHLHLILRQGEWPLDRVMQPLLRRIAGLVHRSHGTEGHVFERRFSDRACLDPSYVRDAIVYTNLNPVRAGVVDNPAVYPWTSHSAFLGEAAESRSMTNVLAVESALGLFAARENLTLEGLRRAYRRYVGWRIRCDRHQAAEVIGHAVAAPPPPPPVWYGDQHWLRTFAPPYAPPDQPVPDDKTAAARAPLDLGEIARRMLAQHDSEIDLERVRSSYKGRAVVQVRRAMAVRMSEAGHPGHAIARYLRVSDQCVSNILTAERRSRNGSAPPPA